MISQLHFYAVILHVFYDYKRWTWLVERISENNENQFAKRWYKALLVEESCTPFLFVVLCLENFLRLYTIFSSCYLFRIFLLLYILLWSFFRLDTTLVTPTLQSKKRKKGIPLITYRTKPAKNLLRRHLLILIPD